MVNEAMDILRKGADDAGVEVSALIGSSEGAQAVLADVKDLGELARAFGLAVDHAGPYNIGPGRGWALATKRSSAN